jgi:hypothetical protein
MQLTQYLSSYNLIALRIRYWSVGHLHHMVSLEYSVFQKKSKASKTKQQKKKTQQTKFKSDGV